MVPITRLDIQNNLSLYPDDSSPRRDFTLPCLQYRDIESHEFENSKPEKPMVDVSRWERALNGKAVRVMHSVNDGAYGGETIFMWDEVKKVAVLEWAVRNRRGESDKRERR